MNKSIIFYSKFPHDQLSMKCLTEINKNPAFSKQFIKICVHDLNNINAPPQIKLPKLILELINKTPILAITGHRNPILGNDAYSWLQNNLLNDDTGIKATSLCSSLADDCSTIDQTEILSPDFFNTMYNECNSSGIFKEYANISESNTKLEIFSDDNDKNSNTKLTDKRLQLLQQQRGQQLISGQPPVGGGLPPMQM